jgi:hypothetical protein
MTPIVSVWSDALDASGTSTSFSFMVPNQSGLAFLGFHFQAVIVDSALNLIDTNDLALTIQP